MPGKKQIKYSNDILAYLKHFKKICTDKKVYLYGAGKFSEEFFEYINIDLFNLCGFIDGDLSKKNQTLKDLIIYHIDDIPELNPDIIVLTTKQALDIPDRLNKIKQKNNLHFEIYNDFFEKIEDFFCIKDFTLFDFNEIKSLNFIDKRQFDKNIDIETAKELFKQSMKIVEIEPFSYCNRKCWFCPNSAIDRRSENHIMPEDLFLKVLRELQQINYDKVITLTRYNEPLSNDLIYTRIGQIRQILPNAFININTNGDYVNANTAKNLYNAGLDRIEVQIYAKEKEENFDVAFSINKIKKLAKLMNLYFEEEEIKIIPEKEVSLEIKYKNSLLISFIGVNMKNNLLNRGGYLDKYFENNSLKERIEPCYASFINFVIDYNGNVMPCCNLRSDIEGHKKFVLGNITQNTIYEIFTFEKNINFKKDFLNYGQKVQECKNCYQYLNILEDTLENRHKIEEIRKYFI